MPALPKPKSVLTTSAILDSVTAKEKLLKLLPSLTEDQAERALIAAEAKPGDIIDEWGNLSKMAREATASTLRHLDEEEAAAGFQPWKREDLL
jgi:hypothetical protein